ncbi:hypothetical protein NK6_2947 [Bradyrhizobium diazoefficiens]|uniref:Uncharacterized protein n=1 Tax=Bradyrhizobium diazoefficiens TaxID=1355477 RepID=A0A0E4BMS6_9BRAD|nr:hypothetical protein NK6_2947 [Bradyrhizobium diazoefficiens]
MLVHGVSLSLRFWQARHPPRYAAYLIPSSPSFPHSSIRGTHDHIDVFACVVHAEGHRARSQHAEMHVQRHRTAPPPAPMQRPGRRSWQYHARAFPSLRTN